MQGSLSESVERFGRRISAKRLFDILASLILIVMFLPVFLLCSLLVLLTSRGPVIHLSERIGKDNTQFRMLKFRTMRIDSPQLATHLLSDSTLWLTPVGKFLRDRSLDELPQLINVLRGEMTLVGPRPSLFNQYDQINLRTDSGCHLLTPGITGWAQVNGRDRISIARKVELDTWYLENRSFALDLKILLMTVRQISHRGSVKR